MTAIDMMRFRIRMIFIDAEKDQPNISGVFQGFFEKIIKEARQVSQQKYISADDIVSRIAQPAFEALQVLIKQYPHQGTGLALQMVFMHLESLEHYVPGLPNGWGETCKAAAVSAGHLGKPFTPPEPW